MIDRYEPSIHDVDEEQLGTTEGKQLAQGQKRLILSIVISYAG
ncbi:hypothetical protein WME79_28955 [Sorangium sp. So ce726]